MSITFPRLALGALACLAVSGCVTSRPGQTVNVVHDLSDVAGCKFIGPVAPPRTSLGDRAYAGYERYEAEVLRQVAARGATHLFISNPSGAWGGVQALGGAYLCVPY
ncbi:hypothetical protein Q8W71_14060 [Methylobacterium sp. NEAU 140]|uniref:hypothetical protein n=1 Tax=Methylobacterium sp. NEAU 140 TaxID=3064945 RepID=UPI002734BE94|nr:hypothetical protein [Methylobacterium sp. NEAU 140]MDP4023756.1 hypothetical protein [Methylobacterium sp. NEAU 140]